MYRAGSVDEEGDDNDKGDDKEKSGELTVLLINQVPQMMRLPSDVSADKDGNSVASWQTEDDDPSMSNEILQCMENKIISITNLLYTRRNQRPVVLLTK